MANAFQVTFDAEDPLRLGRFWGAVLGYVDQPPPDGHESWPAFLTSVGVPESQWDSAWSVVDPDGVGARLLFQKVPEGKAAKNRVHLDVTVGGGRGVPLEERQRRVDARAAELVELGAELVGPGAEPGGYWVVLRDPEGNEFCLQ
ncbi:VOC family protein [Modestobacter sp. Leaf380]|uniref:VOC family protein n=1 Tax=Modestobacter sp. Leaf380 TaxID=1736356 RepID=UPI0006FC68D9|nr:VOC family protein [Modestobacter sp. Leaf380]KQS69257.1 glyoxalase [Modestobacter sp. Leaf380]